MLKDKENGLDKDKKQLLKSLMGSATNNLDLNKITTATKSIVTEEKFADGSIGYSILFSGVEITVEHKPTENEISIFEMGILTERERIWDVSDEVDDTIMRKILNY